jgi:hypothetical protein
MNRPGFALACSLLLALACSSSGPAPKRAAVDDARPDAAAFPPVGPVSLELRAPPREGALYQLVVFYEGRTETSLSGPHANDEPQTNHELLQLELDYRQMPVAAPSEDDIASSLVLDALRRRMQMAPPGSLHLIEVGDDRLRTTQDNKVDVDLRGAQPKGDLTPRSILQKPFALLVTDRWGTAKSVTLRGTPTVRKMLSTMPLRETVGYMQLARPHGPVSPGATWTAKRFLPSTIGRLGVSAQIEYRLVGFEKVGDVPCARVSIRAQRDDANTPSELGFTFEQVRLELGGDAWIELDTGLVRVLRVEDIAAVIYERKGTAGTAAKMRSRYEARASLSRLDVKTTTEKWADGSKRFADVK